MRETCDVAAVEADRGTSDGVSWYHAGQGGEALGRTQRAVRVTVFDEAYQPLAERLVYRQRRARLLQVQVDPIKKSFVPRERSRLDIDDARRVNTGTSRCGTVGDRRHGAGFADDKTGHAEPPVS